ncbi:MAG: exo-beta-N-acetylmuramidase NamZ domain-containing protein [Bacillota bacterium]
MKKIMAIAALLAAIILFAHSASDSCYGTPAVKLGDEVLLTRYHYLIEGKKIGLVTNQSGVTGRGESMVDILAGDRSTRLAALYAPEHGLDGTAKAGEYVESYTHEKLGIPVFSLYGKTRMPTEDMLRGIDLLLFDIQDIGARSYTYMSTLNYCLVAAKKYGKPVIVLDRPNPLGGEIVEGPVLEDRYKTFVGVDNLPMAHGMTAGELALFFNRNIGADLRVIKMEGYNRSMTYQDTGLPWVQTSPNIPDLDSVFGYMATGLGEGTGIFQADKFKWIGGKGIDSQKFAGLLNRSGLPGVTFIPEDRDGAGGVRLKITDYHTFNPARTGLYALAYAHSLNNFDVPKSGREIVMFDKIMGTAGIGGQLEQGLSPEEIVDKYTPGLNRFKEERKKYLLYGYGPGRGPDGEILYNVVAGGNTLSFDSPPYIDSNNRLIVPVRAITEALGAGVSWDPSARKATITGQGGTVVFTIDSVWATVDGKQKRMDTCPVIKNGRTMVPVRYISEYLGYSVDWDPDTRTVSIKKP